MANFCDKCGAELDERTGLCPVCGGAPVRGETPAEGSKNGGTSGSAEKHTKGKKRHTALWIVLGAVAALLIAAAVVGVLEHFRIVNIPVVRKLEERMGIRPYAEEIYDENGVLQGYEARKDNGDYTYEYDARGRKIKVSWHEGTRSGYDTYEYDARGWRIKVNYYADDGTLRGYDTYEYDSEGREIKECYYDDGALSGYYTYEYDAKGQRIGIYEYDGNGVLQYTYDGDWNLISSY